MGRMYNNNGPNGHLFYVGGDLMMRRGMLPIIMLPDGDLRIALHLVPFWILTIWGSVHMEEIVVGWRRVVQLLAGIISLRRVPEANPGRSHGSADTLPLRHSASCHVLSDLGTFMNKVGY